MKKTKVVKLVVYVALLVVALIIVAFTIKKQPVKQIKIENTEKNISIEKTFVLPELLRETSGLIYYKGLIWTFNDSGGEPEIFSYSIADSSIKQRVTLINGNNYDWEEISQDSNFVYVGDFGNNYGNRNNLCIYKIDKSKLPKRNNKAIKAKKIQFTYPNYTSTHLSLKFVKSAFDCEAMICLRDSIILFTKNWTNNTTTIYQIPKQPGKYIAKRIGDFDSDGLITAANLKDNQLVLLGYKNLMPFLWRFYKFTNPNLTPTDGTRYELTPLAGKQTEGITIIDSITYFVSAEKTVDVPQLFVVKVKP